MLGVCDYSEKVDCKSDPLVYPPTENHVVMQELKGDPKNFTLATCDSRGEVASVDAPLDSLTVAFRGRTEHVKVHAW